MKYLNYILALLLFIICLSLRAETISEQVADNSRSVNPYEGSFSYEASSPVDIQLPNFSLTADSGSLLHGVDIQVSMLPYKSGMMLQSNMENVCLLSDGVRLLPNGEHFPEDAPALVTLAYDPARIPMGYTPKDIYTYYSDDNTHWHRLERAAVDTVAHTIISYTTHFTDFANAVIKVPEMPESKAFVPTDMQDLPDPDPLTGIPMIAVPQANNMGTAELSYPIQLPPGRHGLQPDVDLHYSSAGGNGLLGVGWSIAQPAVTIDTRWGVPRYDLCKETEAYLINGEPFLLHDNTGAPIPLPHMASSFVPRRAQATRFYARDQRNQSKAVRHGQTPDKYWWSVTTTDGVTYYYGYDPFNGEIDENSVLRTDNGYIGYWALTCIMDQFSNYVHYWNVNDNNEIAPAQIDYTGNIIEHLAPLYSVLLFYHKRPDVQTDARLGLLRHQNKLLCHLHIKMDEHTQIASYLFNYEYGSHSLFKSRLASIQKTDGLIENFHHCYNHPEELLVLNRDGWAYSQDIIYANITQENIPYESSPGSTTSFSYEDAYSSSQLFGNSQSLLNSSNKISQSTSSSWNIGGTLTLGFGVDVWQTTLSAGGNYSYGQSAGDVESMLIDLNGDGLIDQLFKSGSNILYRRQLPNHSFASPVPINGLHVLSRESSSSHNFGLQLSYGASLSYSPSISDSYTDIYFSDVNGDGLPDLVTPSGVSINTLNGDIPSFTQIGDTQENLLVHGNCCSRAITFDGEVDERLMCTVSKELVTRIPLSSILPSDDGESQFVEHDVDPDEPEDDSHAIVDPAHWEALPTTFNNAGAGEFLRHYIYTTRQSNHDDNETYTHAPFAEDGVRATPEKDYPSSSNSQTWEQILRNLYPGEEYSFSLAGNYVDVYRLKTECDSSSTEPNVDIVRVWVSDRTDSIKLSSIAALLQDTSLSRLQSRMVDGVHLRIQWNHSVSTLSPDRLHADTAIVLYDKYINADDYTPDTSTYNIPVSVGDVLFFRLSARNDRRFDNVDWGQTILTTNNDTLYSSSRDYLCTGEQYFSAPAQGHAKITLACENRSTVPVIVRANHMASDLVSFTLPAQSDMDTIITTPVAGNDSIVFYIDTISSEPQWSKIRVIPQVEYYGNLVIDTLGNTLSDTLQYHPDVRLKHSHIYAASPLYRRIFGPLHRGWGWFAYNDVNKDHIIVIDSLRNEEDAEKAYANEHSSSLISYTPSIDMSASDDSKLAQVEQCFSTVHTYDPLASDKHWVPVHPNYAANQWTAYGNTGSFGQYTLSTSRQLNDAVDSIMAAVDVPTYDSPIPTLQEGQQRLTTIRKSTRSIQHSISIGAGFLSPSISWGDYDVRSDYMDMNGDGFPDFVGIGGVQYTYPWGGIGEIMPALPEQFNSYNASSGNAFSGAKTRTVHVASNGVRNNHMKNSDTDLGLSSQMGGDGTNIAYMDMNADGLPDIVDAKNHRVRYNLGYSFTMWYTMPALSIAEGTHIAASASLGFSLSQYSISGGVNMSVSDNIATQRLMDIDGDGHPDIVSYDGINAPSVLLNQGDGFIGNQSVNIPSSQFSQTHSSGANVSVTGGFSFLGIKFDIGVQVSPWGQSSTETQADFMDVNGDGYVDYIYTTPMGLSVQYNRNGSRPVNLLKAITNPTGQTITINYSLSQPSTNHRTRVWEMSQVTDSIAPSVCNPRVHRYNYTYQSPFYDNFEKADYGYNRVNTVDHNSKHKSEIYENSYYIGKGEKLSVLISDEQNRRLIGYHQETRYYDSASIYQTDKCNDIALHVGTEGYWTDYFDPEIDATPKITTLYNKVYDRHHNLIRYIDHGDVAITGDEWEQNITYKNNTSYNLISLPSHEIVREGISGTGPVLRLNRVKYDWKGKPYQIIAEDVLTSRLAMHSFKYDAFGNIRMYYAPWNANYERVNYYYEYDPLTQTHVKDIQNQFGETNKFEYDLRYGLRQWHRDAAGNEMVWQYDWMGRLINIIAPNELHDSLPFSVHYTYRLPYHDLQAPSHCNFTYPHVTKVAADHQLASAEVTLYDARGMQIQRKAWKYTADRQEWVADGLVYKDPWYRPVETYSPFLSSIAVVPLWIPDNINQQPYQTLYQYDVLDRNTKIIYSDGTEVNTTYNVDLDYAGNKRLATHREDENHLISHTLMAPQEWTIQTIAPDAAKTVYTYNPIGELMSVIDADGYKTEYKYDGFGNRIQRTHPDARYTRWNYAPDGSLVSLETANLAPYSMQINYDYCFNRLTRIIYPQSPTNNVRYLYNTAGQLAIQQDATGTTRFYYDRMGNVWITTRRVIVPTENNTYTFRTLTEYDTFGRLRTILYPDAETVVYNYQGDGLTEIVRKQYGNAWEVLMNHIYYDPMGRIIHKVFGNGVRTTYQYDPRRNRLANIRTDTSCNLQDIDYLYDGAGNITQIDQSASACSGMGGTYRDYYHYDLQYRLRKAECPQPPFTYDFQANYSPAGRFGHDFCGNTSMADMDARYGYDDQRWTHQPRVVYDAVSGTHMELTWDNNGNLFRVMNCDRKKVRFHDWDEENRLRMVVGNKEVGYYGYDANGDRVYKLTGGSEIFYINDEILDAIVRIDNAVLYPNPYVTVTKKDYSKHYYLGTERFATIIGMGGFKWMSMDAVGTLSYSEKAKRDAILERYNAHFPFGQYYHEKHHNVDIDDGGGDFLQYNCPQTQLEHLMVEYDEDILLGTMHDNLGINDYERDIYYTHTNHLGSSSWITDFGGHPIQYLHYLPYGQLLANQTPYGYDERYKFTGKERDAETGYDFFGARYYWSLLKHWTKVDPLVDDYPWISPYAYGLWNPIKYIDPDGRKCTLSVNYKTNTITISAKYYALKGDSRYAQKAANFWNNQKGLTYTAKDGTNYSVQFALNVYSSKNPEKDAGTDDNTFKIVSMLGTNTEGYKKTGVTEANYKISVVDAYKEETTAAHEVGHTLMNVQGGQESEHTTTGVMTKSISDKGRSASVSQETVNSIVESNGFKQNPTLWQRIRSWFE